MQKGTSTSKLLISMQHLLICFVNPFGHYCVEEQYIVLMLAQTPSITNIISKLNIGERKITFKL